MAAVQLATGPVDLDARAYRLLRLGLASAVLLRDRDPRTARRAMQQLDREELLDLATLMCACVDIDKTEGQLLAWWLGPTVPEHADERYGDAPPLRIIGTVAHG